MATQPRIPGTGKGKRKPAQTFIQRSRSVGAEEKAGYHQIQGAGKSKVKRKFLGLTDADKAELTARVGAHVSVVLRRAG